MAQELGSLFQSTAAVSANNGTTVVVVTYTSIHLLSSSIVTLIVAFGKDIVLPWFKTCCMVVPWRSAVWRTNAIDI